MPRKKKKSKGRVREFLAYGMNEGFVIVEASGWEEVRDLHHPLNIIDETYDIDPIIMRQIRDNL